MKNIKVLSVKCGSLVFGMGLTRKLNMKISLVQTLLSKWDFTDGYILNRLVYNNINITLLNFSLFTIYPELTVLLKFYQIKTFLFIYTLTFQGMHAWIFPPHVILFVIKCKFLEVNSCSYRSISCACLGEFALTVFDPVFLIALRSVPLAIRPNFSSASFFLVTRKFI